MQLSSLIAPLPIEAFVGDYWNRMPLHVTGAPDRFAALTTTREAIFATLAAKRHVDVKAQYIDGEGRHCEFPIEAWQARSIFDAGMTVCASGIDVHVPELREWAADFKFTSGFAGRVNFSCYWSPPGAGFGMHYDDRPVFILQLEGAKRWSFSRRPGVRAPIGNLVYTKEAVDALRAAGTQVFEPIEAELLTARLSPGDVLYLPAGVWHRTAADGAPSFGLTMRTFGGTAGEVVEEAVREVLNGDEPARAPLPLFDGGSPVVTSFPPAVLDALERQLRRTRDALASMTSLDLTGRWARAQSVPADVRRRSSRAIAPSDALRVTRRLRFFVAPATDGEPILHVQTRGTLLELPVRENALLMDVLARGQFIASDATSMGGAASDWDEIAPTLNELAELGILEFVLDGGCEQEGEGQ